MRRYGGQVGVGDEQEHGTKAGIGLDTFLADWVRDYEETELKLWREAMIKIDIEKVLPPKPGKVQGYVVTMQGATYGFFPDKISPMPGPAEVEVVSRHYQGKEYWNITSIKQNAAAVPRPYVDPPESRGISPGVGGSSSLRAQIESAPWWMPFVSNTVAHAVQAGFITEPGMVLGWARAAKEAALALGEKEEPPIPF
jgi:hypothetical protein